LQIIEWVVAFLSVDEKYEIGNVDDSFFFYILTYKSLLYMWLDEGFISRYSATTESFLTLHPSFLYHQRHLGLVVLSPLLPNLG
jgi:hypothetical protein